MMLGVLRAPRGDGDVLSNLQTSYHFHHNSLLDYLHSQRPGTAEPMEEDGAAAEIDERMAVIGGLDREIDALLESFNKTHSLVTSLLTQFPDFSGSTKKI
jgi:hypothetical protein